jgi:hypothetical protein
MGHDRPEFDARCQGTSAGARTVMTVTGSATYASRRLNRCSAVPGRHTSHRFADRDLLVGGRKCVGVSHRDLLLTRPQLWVILLYHDTLLFQGFNDVHDNRTGRIHANRAKAVAAVQGEKTPFSIHTCQVNLVLEGSHDM